MPAQHRAILWLFYWVMFSKLRFFISRAMQSIAQTNVKQYMQHKYINKGALNIKK